MSDNGRQARAFGNTLILSASLVVNNQPNQEGSTTCPCSWQIKVKIGGLQDMAHLAEACLKSSILPDMQGPL